MQNRLQTHRLYRKVKNDRHRPVTNIYLDQGLVLGLVSTTRMSHLGMELSVLVFSCTYRQTSRSRLGLGVQGLGLSLGPLGLMHILYSMTVIAYHIVIVMTDVNTIP